MSQNLIADFFNVIQTPELLLDFDGENLEQLVRMLKSRLLFGRVTAALPEKLDNAWLADQKLSADLWSDVYHRQIRWEVYQIIQATRHLSCTTILLKGAAYELKQLPNAAGRFVSDVDILVEKDQLENFEHALIQHGWEVMKLDDYDQEYYRKWMHELPPLRHKERGTIVDVHHTITPETSRLNPNVAYMLQDAEKLDGIDVSVLCAEDMVLHLIVHLFYDGDLSNSTRELLDLRELIKAFSADEQFWQRLMARTSLHGLIRPLYYALYQLEHLMQYPLPDNVRLAAGLGAPSWPFYYAINGLMSICLLPPVPDKKQPWRVIAMWLMYIRSHWLRMPPLLLAKHLITKWKKAD